MAAERHEDKRQGGSSTIALAGMLRPTAAGGPQPHLAGKHVVQHVVRHVEQAKDGGPAKVGFHQLATHLCKATSKEGACRVAHNTASCGSGISGERSSCSLEAAAATAQPACASWSRAVGLCDWGAASTAAPGLRQLGMRQRGASQPGMQIIAIWTESTHGWQSG